MESYQWMNANFLYLLNYLLEVNYVQVRRSNSLWLLSSRRLADFDAPNFRCNNAFGPISAVVSYRHLSETMRAGRNLIDHLLAKITGKGIWCNWVLLGSNG